MIAAPYREDTGEIPPAEDGVSYRRQRGEELPFMTHWHRKIDHGDRLMRWRPQYGAIIQLAVEGIQNCGNLRRGSLTPNAQILSPSVTAVDVDSVTGAVLQLKGQPVVAGIRAALIIGDLPELR